MSNSIEHAQHAQHAHIDCLSPSGERVAVLRLVAAANVSPAPLLLLDEIAAMQLGESALQLRESAHYEYQLERPTRAGIAQPAGAWRLRCPLAHRHLACGPDEDRGILDTGTYCGDLRLEIVDHERNQLVAVAKVTVRSVKLSYREDFRAMLQQINERCVGLIHDLRSPTRAPLTPTFNSEGMRWPQQIAFLCEQLEAPDFLAAMQQVLAQPHRHLVRERQLQPVHKPLRSTRPLAQQMATRADRIALPARHPLAARLSSLPISLPTEHAIDDLNTPENRFAKFALQTWQHRLAQGAKQLRALGSDWVPVAERAEQATRTLAHWLRHPMFDGVLPLQQQPRHPWVLQRHGGYRAIAQTWLNFHANAELHWPAGEDLFFAGQRNVALLYEYWVFFQLLDWFCDRFDCHADVARQWVVSSAEGWLLNLKHGAGVELARTTDTLPSPHFEADSGTATSPAPTVGAMLRYNQTFVAAQPDGSWTRTMRPDITLSLWPSKMSMAEASAANRLVHLHFDAKYRLDNLSDVLGQPSGPQREDLLKMHAYRDAIRHTQGAYVIYPGSAADLVAQERDRTNLMFAGEGLLPSLGAFALVPSHASDDAKGMSALRRFLDTVVAHLQTDV